MRIYWYLTVAWLGLNLLFGCAHVAPVVNAACSPVASEVAAVVAAFAPEDYQAQIAKYIAAGHALCQVQAAVDQELGGQALLASSAATTNPVTLAHMRMWRAANP